MKGRLSTRKYSARLSSIGPFVSSPRTQTRVPYRAGLEWYRRNRPLQPANEMLSSQQITTSHSREHDDFFRYTGGRWVWNEEQQLQDRFRVFNVLELQRIAARSVGSSKCLSITKMAEGGYNKIFRLVTDDGKVVIARIPNPNAGPAFYTTASEVATMEFVRTVLNIPVPTVFDWNANADNPVGAEYIIMAEAPGVPLAASWDDLSPDSKLAIMRELVSVEKKLLSVSFSNYGNIYFASDEVEDSVPATFLGDIPSRVKEMASARFSVGPSADKGFWEKERSKSKNTRGPWSTPVEYAEAIAYREIEWIKNYAVPKAADDPLLVSSAQNSPQAHIALLERFLRVCPSLLAVEADLASSTLWHTDLHSSNVFIQNDHISSIIDWQGAFAGPLLLQAQPSDLVNYQGEIMLERPADFENFDEEEKARIRRQIFKSTLFRLYILQTEEENPRLAKVFKLDHGKTRRMPVMFAGNTWDDDIVAFREALLNVERYWNEISPGTSCPIHFTEDDLKNHRRDAEGWNEVQDFFDNIQGLVQRDGWTHNETYDQACNLFADLRKLGLREFKDKEREWFETKTRWAN